ncbi:hypothetical protein GPECTOR_138g661 [Gonium pectorale]|uniref:Uncharacterized protein n=1 Tax=Gonium pectorale TaxID=33097 RepID=A0A150FZN8_GONPE|nr:hypothetical protein GPECTOR_138g661 [Gonium pectorale]|eukprot:KXZ42530.1 hypothetical protein GPECTOR_138g661 [Gonium pectorale]
MGFKSRVDVQLAEQRRVNDLQLVEQRRVVEVQRAEQRRVNDLQHAEQRRVLEVQQAEERARYEQHLFDAAFHADYQEWRRAMTAPRSMDGKDG